MLTIAATISANDSIPLFKSLATPDSATGAVVTVHQDPVMKQAIEAQQKPINRNGMRGFRVQLFSSNNPRTARDAAFQVEKKIQEKIPNLATYVVYTSPFWKVRVGNCATRDDAQHLRQFIIDKMPQFSGETYIVPDLILPNQ